MTSVNPLRRHPRRRVAPFAGASLARAGLLAAALLSPAAAQSATAKLYAKADGERVLVAIQVTPEPGAWVYDDDADSGGAPAVVTLSPADATWSPAVFPEPTIKEDVLGPAKVHKKTFVVYAAGRGEGLTPDLVRATIRGQVCNESLCVMFDHADLEPRGEGKAELWTAFPASLANAPAAAGGVEKAGGEAGRAEQGEGAAAAPPRDDWKPVFPPGRNIVGRAFARDFDSSATVVVELAIAPGYHVYHGPEPSDIGPGIGLPTTATIEGGGVDWDAFVFPEPHEHDDPTGMTYVHEDRLVLRTDGMIDDEFDPEGVRIVVAGQICDDKGCILFEEELELEEDQGPDALFVRPSSTPNAGPSNAGPSLEDAPSSDAPRPSGGLLQFLGLAILAGLVTLLMPCTYPMIPITISYFTKQATARGGNVLSLALTYGAGIVALFVAIGLLVGKLIVAYAQHWIMNVAIGVLFIVFALALFGMITLQPPRFLMNAAGRASQKGGYAGVFLMGACLVITSFTCTAPFVGSLLGAGGTGGGGSQLRIALGMGVFGLTMATPFVLLALMPGKLHALPQAGGWMETLKVFMGFVEVAASLKFFSNADVYLAGGDFVEGGGLLSRELFLALWAAIAVAAAMYLFGRINLKGESPDGNIGPGRLVGGLGSLLFAAYCWLGVEGYQLGGAMTALIPPSDYSAGLIPVWSGEEEGHTIVVDDYDEAVAQAVASDKLLLVNFTGHT